MNELWLSIREKVVNFLVWAYRHHPGKLIGTSIGFLMGLLLVTLGFWRTLILALFISVGFLVGKRQDDHHDVTSWITKSFK